MPEATAAEVLVGRMARQIRDGAVVATGVASPLPLLAIAVARATHAPRLTYISCVGALNPGLDTLFDSSEDLRYLEGRTAEVSIAELFDHARKGRVDTLFFGAAEVDARGDTNLTATGSLEHPSTKFPGVAGACTLRRWAHDPILLVTRQSRRNLVPKVQIVSTRDERRPARLLTDLGEFELGPNGATLRARHPSTSVEAIRERTGFAFSTHASLEVTAWPDPAALEAMRRIDPNGLRERLVR